MDKQVLSVEDHAALATRRSPQTTGLTKKMVFQKCHQPVLLVLVRYTEESHSIEYSAASRFSHPAAGKKGMSNYSETSKLVEGGFKWFTGHPPISVHWSGLEFIDAPREAMRDEYQDRDLRRAHVAFNNHASTVLPDIRIKLPFRPNFEQRPVRCLAGLALDQWSYNGVHNEIKVPILDPRTSIRFVIYTTAESIEPPLGRPVFLHSGRIVSKRSLLLGIACASLKRKPDF